MPLGPNCREASVTKHRPWLQTPPQEGPHPKGASASASASEPGVSSSDVASPRFRPPSPRPPASPPVSGVAEQPLIANATESPTAPKNNGLSSIARGISE